MVGKPPLPKQVIPAKTEAYQGKVPKISVSALSNLENSDQKFESLTKTLEKFGAFKNITKLGTKLRWEDELNRLGIVVKDHKAKLIGNKLNVS